MRVIPVPETDLNPELAAFADGLMPLVSSDWQPVWDRLIRMMAQAPEQALRLFPYYEGVWLRNRLGPRLTELVRFAIANQTRCPLCLDIRYEHAMRDGISEDDIAAVGRRDEQPFSPAEAAALRFATDFGGNHHAIGDEHFAALREHFDDEQIVELLLLCALALGIGRILMITDLLTAACPARPAVAG
ncbi:carboxymuconolactone decarboxylase family protein [Patulibacter defluvii]|uniref:carboxymuconolactone decarboxylase family protein n=1 Tax=Patulibacter defluvii TaxID=3095358 RepID=UPI002A755DE9|nr:carboxymuconolactone decarboxylase family protein [Patulibacter sp. DM4]